MNEHEAEVKKAKYETTKKLIESIYWIAFWFLVIGGCVANNYIDS